MFLLIIQESYSAHREAKNRFTSISKFFAFKHADKYKFKNPLLIKVKSGFLLGIILKFNSGTSTETKCTNGLKSMGEAYYL